MKNHDTRIEYHDPRYINGDPYEVVDFVCKQASGIVQLYKLAMTDSEALIRNAVMQQALDLGNDSTEVAVEWDTSPLRNKLSSAQAKLDEIQAALESVGKAASWNPNEADGTEA